MNNFYHLLDLKLSIAGVLFLAVSLSQFDVGLKILGTLIFIGYNIRRWYLMEKNINKNKYD